MPSEPTDEQIRRYLLGELPAEERLAVQGALCEGGAEVFERVQEVENDLIDLLARGGLSRGEADRVRQFVAATGQQDRVRFARALAGIAAGEARRAPVGRWESLARLFSIRAALAFACCVLAVMAGALWVENSRLRRTLQGNRVATMAPAGSVFSVVLPAGTIRGSDRLPRIAVPSGAQAVEFQLPLEPPADYTAFAISLKTGAGALVWSESGALTPGADRVAVLAPAGVLAKGRYELALSGTARSGREEILDYFYFWID